MTANSLEIIFNPLVAAPILWVLFAFGILLSIASLRFAWRSLFLRAASLAAIGILLLNPSLAVQERTPLKDVALIITDHSASQNFGSRSEQAAAALESIKKQLTKFPDLEYRIQEAPIDKTNAAETILFDGLESLMADVPESLRAGTIVISDGQIHDNLADISAFKSSGPLHLLLTGSQAEKDRQIAITNAPAYGIAGQSITLRYKIMDHQTGASAHSGEEIATVTLSGHARQPETFFVPLDEEQTITLPIKHAGDNVFNLKVNALPGELTPLNNQANIMIQGVRDRLRVLLVSGQPHAGTRTWRDLLKSDPSVDLVHFTILRRPEKFDSTPPDEMSLIAFPFRELFEVKLYDFDLIIFDRYQLNKVLPDFYFANIARYVQEGGALLLSTGPEYASEDSVFNTALSEILPAAPDGTVLNGAFTPMISDIGARHPVTQNLLPEAKKTDAPPWGPWQRQIGLSSTNGDILMTGLNQQPLLILNRTEEGRVAQLASDHIWLWHRGHDGGGPHAELLRRIVHWLMQEPELDEKALAVKTSGQTISLKANSLHDSAPRITATRPDGSPLPLRMNKTSNGIYELDIKADQNGIWAFENATGQITYALVGGGQTEEFKSVLSTDQKLLPFIRSSGGSVIRLENTPEPLVRQSENTNNLSGQTWLGLRKNSAYTITGTQLQSLTPPLLALIFALTLLLLMWWREGRR
jgi:hypothetical protein